MGLDVYFRRYNNYDAFKAYEARQEQAHEDMWGATGKKYEALTDDEKESVRAKQKAWDESNPPSDDELDSTFEEIDSKVHPDHMFKIGYLRSSYNEGGINHILRDLIGKDLYYVFFGDDEEAGREYMHKPDWQACLARAVEVRDLFARDIAEHGAFGIRKVSLNMFTPFEQIEAVDARSALQIFRKNHKQHQQRRAAIAAEGRKPNDWESGAYSTQNAEFSFEEPYRVVGMISGMTENVGATIRGVKPPNNMMAATYLIYEIGKPSERPYDWYQKALEITVEGLEWMLAQPDIEHYRLAWSG